ncbi:calcium and integrin-binding protein 1-like isoform X3 [Pomacea canaliculata]|uniref:calcium and integrin-binding protein 1-like isoform X3 n=1 Tax=Pomacea canaliculata TaxID=400727 RepID=UPI000D7371B7|nr:calcium and integrin-binding protein 1-like isoform X3 [Pomacea canaliculata]
MGLSHSAFSMQELNDYETLTYLTKKEILHVHERFSNLNPSAVKQNKNAKLPFETVSELKLNPFNDQIMKVFSVSGDGITFEDFLDMMSVFSDRAPQSVKAEYAFRIYDFDEDDMISQNDLKMVIQRLAGKNSFSEEQMQHMIDNILKEADLDGDKKLSFAEFEHAIFKAPDFVNSFRIQL